MIEKFTIYGERCSGTNYLQKLLTANFEATFVENYGQKHFFGKNQAFEDSDDTLFVCICREPIKWINSMYREMHYIPLKYEKISDEERIHKFLNEEFWSADEKKELMEDRNIYTGERYKNVFEMRQTKLQYLIDDLPKFVKHYIFIRYEDLCSDLKSTLQQLQEKGLRKKDESKFPIDIKNYVRFNEITSIPFEDMKKKDKIPKSMILTNSNFLQFTKYEEQLKYYPSRLCEREGCEFPNNGGLYCCDTCKSIAGIHDPSCISFL